MSSKKQLRRIERELAYSAARSDIETYCKPVHHSGRYYGRWYDTTCRHGFVKMAVRYLEMINHLKHHPDHSHLVMVMKLRESDER